MKTNMRCIWSIGLVTCLLLGLLAVPAGAQTPCDSTNEPLRTMQTRQQLRQFVDCAVAHVEAIGWEQAVTDFTTAPAWSDGSIYLYGVDEAAINLFSAGQDFAPGMDLSVLEDADGVQIVPEIVRITQRYGSGYVYYHFNNPASGEIEPKIAYAKALEVDGETRILGSGLYPRDVPNACSPQYVRASLVYSAHDLERFVTCAERYLRQHGIQALYAFNADPRWVSGSTYLFLGDTESLMILAHGGDADLIGQDLMELIDPDGVLIMQEIRRIATAFGEGYVYYGFANPATGQTEPKATFAKEVHLDGRSYILGSGLYIPTPKCHSLPFARDVDTRAELELFVTCAQELVQTQGEAAFDLLTRHPQWIGGAIYTYLMVGENCQSLLYALDYKADEVHSCDLEDVEGKPVNRMIVDLAASEEGKGWLEYQWLNPESNEVETKTAFVMGVMINDTLHAIGAGLYALED